MRVNVATATFLKSTVRSSDYPKDGRPEIAFLGPEVRRQQLASLERLAAKPAFELRYSTLESAVAALEGLTVPVPAAV